MIDSIRQIELLRLSQEVAVGVSTVKILAGQD
jgi:hypothetical protein